MANGEFIDGLSPNALKEIKEFVAEVDKGAKSVEKINEAFKKIKLPSQGKGPLKDVDDEVEKSIKRISEAERLTNRINNARTAEALEVAKLKVELAGLNAENKKNAIETLGTLNSYQKLSAQLNTLRTDVKAVATDMYLLESAGKKNSTQYKTLSATYDENIKKVTQLDTVLKKIDASTGQYNRNVGNYASGFNGLNASIQQILREAPSAAVSLNTFFLGISNNLPMFFDEITKVNAGLKELKELSAIANQELAAQTSIQQASAKASEQAQEALESQLSTIISSVEASAAQATAIREQVGAHIAETSATGQASVATIANTEATLVNAGATAEQVAAIQADIIATGNATRVSAEHTLALNAQTVATLEANTAVASSPSLMSRLGASLFSVNTLLTVGVLALTLYGGKIIEVISNWLKGATASDALKQSLEELDSIRVSSIKSVVKEGIELNQNLKIAKNVNVSLKEREIAAKKVLDQYPFWFENLGKEAILNGNVEKAVKGVNDALLARAKSNAAVGKITENQSSIIDLEEKRLTLTKELESAQNSYNGRLKIYEETKDPSVNTALAQAEARLNRIREDYVDNEKEITKITEINNRLLGYANDEAEKAIGLDYRAEKSNKTKSRKDEIDYLANVYALRKRNNEILMASEEATMNDEAKNFNDRREAMENYYFQMQENAKLTYDEEIRLNDLSYKKQKETYRKAIEDGTATQETLTQLEYQYLLNRNLIRTNFEEKSNQNTIEKAKALRGVLESITDQNSSNIISEKALEDLRQVGLYLANITKGTNVKGFEALDKKLKQIGDNERTRNAENLRIELQRNIAEQENIKLTEGKIEQNQTYSALKGRELELQKEIQGIENEALKESTDLLKEKAVAVSDYLKSFTEGFFGETGFPTLFKALNKEIIGFGENFAVTFNTVAEIAQETIAFLNQNQQAYFDAQYSRLEREKDIAIEFAGESTTAREEIERQYEERRKQIRRQEAEAQKQNAIFNAVINTAQAVVGALAKLPDPSAVPLSIAAGIIGAAQIATIASQPIPEYRMGTDFHKGGPAIVGDGGKHEVVYQPSSGFSVTPKTDTLVDLERGAKVYPDMNSFLKNSGAMLGGIPNIELESSGISKNEMEYLMSKYMKSDNSPTYEVEETKIVKFIANSVSRQKSMNDRFSFKPKKV